MVALGGGPQRFSSPEEEQPAKTTPGIPKLEALGAIPGNPSSNFILDNPIKTTLGCIGMGLVALGHVNMEQRSLALRAPELSLDGIEVRIVDLTAHENRSREVNALEAMLKGVESPAGSKLSVTDRERLEVLKEALSLPAPVATVQVEAVAVLTNLTHVATHFKNAADNPVYTYALQDLEGQQTNLKLQCHEPLSKDGSPALVKFATNLRTASNVEGEITLVPTDYPQILSLPGSGEAILQMGPVPTGAAPMSRTRR